MKIAPTRMILKFHKRDKKPEDFEKVLAYFSDGTVSSSIYFKLIDSFSLEDRDRKVLYWLKIPKFKIENEKSNMAGLENAHRI